MKDIASSYKDIKANINEALFSEFEEDLGEWDASITTNNAIVFHSPKVLFEINKSNINNEFKTILDDFFPRYMRLSQKRAYEVLSYCYSLEDDFVKENRVWIEKYFRANGMAFAKLKDKTKARRVEFVIQMKSEDKVYEILEIIPSN